MPRDDVKFRRQIDDLLSRKSSRIDLESLLGDLIDGIGGTKQLAAEYWRVYFAAVKSPMVQQKMLLMIQQLVHATTVHNLGKPLDLAMLDDIEIQAMEARLLDRMIDASQAAAESADLAAGPGAESPAAWAAPREDEGDPAADVEGDGGG